LKAVLEARDIDRRVGNVDILRGVSLAIAPGEAVALLGPSGCGKTSFLHILGLLDRPTGGRVLIDGEDVWGRSTASQADMRLSRIGLVYQERNLLGHLTALENVAIPAWKRLGSRKRGMVVAAELLERLGLSERATSMAAVLSTGEAQRVAIARALVNAPSVLLADEPTGSLDSASSEAVLAAIQQARSRGTAIIMVTHDPKTAEGFDRTHHMLDGKFVQHG
jgi:ABC-type lipoprotein export system ATPase subunit